jgi:ABC-type multidrug transport system ATPase subunit
MTAPILVADCVTKSYGERRVLSAGTLRAVPGTVRVIFGRNGAGKSTLMKIASGWMQADSGMVHLLGEPVLRPSLASLARKGVFYLPDHDLLSSSFTVRQQLHFFHDVYRRRGVDEAAKLADVRECLDRRVHSLSGGEGRRAELAAVLVRQPLCLLADEPYRGIAPVDHEQVTRLLRLLASEGCAVVVTGHEVPSLLAAADHVTWCTAGTTYELGAPSAARAHERFVQEYLGPREHVSQRRD